MIYTYVQSPLGDQLLARKLRGGGLTGLYLPTGKHSAARRPEWQREDTAFDDVRAQLDEYFAGERRGFDVPLEPVGSGFQRQVWTALAEIPYGETGTYGQTATKIGAPTASRAVGLANGQSPISIIVPCHRVIGANGSLTGYGGGLNAKRWLLSHELAHVGLFA